MTVFRRFLVALILLTITTSLFADGKNFRVFGHLTQGFGVSKDYQIYGLPTNGTSDYRNLALLFRFDVSEKNRFAIQLNHKRIGLNPTMDYIEDVELDWGFYEYSFNENTSLKIGKVLLPMGIFNEVRDVGILLPFYRAPASVYIESRSSAEAVDGAVFSYEKEIKNDWRLQTNFFAGQWSWVEWAIIPNLLNGVNELASEEVEIKNVLGGQFWLNTPLEGVRLGLSGYRGKQVNAFTFLELANFVDPYMTVAMVSLDAQFQKIGFQSEYKFYDFGESPTSLLSYYALASVAISEKLSINAQYEHLSATKVYTNPLFYPNLVPFTQNYDLLEDLGFSLNYRLTNQFVIKVESHFGNGFIVEDQLTNPFKQSPPTWQYHILSFSAGF